jgi:hypothetical protein
MVPEQGPVAAPAVATPGVKNSLVDLLVRGLAPVNHPADCREVWKSGLLARVADGQVALAVDTLFDYHVKAGFFGVRTEGMRREHGVGPDKVDVQYAPNRDKVPLVEVNAHGSKECALCRPPMPEERGLSWRGYNVWPNAFPYLPESQQHVVITAARHVGQSFSAAILGDMVDYQRAASRDQPVTMHYNGIAGNSQFHLHWHASRELLPLQRMVDDGSLPLTRLHAGRGGHVDTYDRGFFTGILVTGDKGYVTRWAASIVSRLDGDPLTRGAYNLLLLHPRDGQVRLAVIPRRADNLKPEVGSFGKVGLGAFSLGGTIVVPRESVPPTFGQDLCAAVDQTLVRPHQLPWLQELARAPSHPALVARSAL